MTIVPHAAIRAKERYGLDLSLDDVRALAKRCLGGEGLTERQVDGSQRHTLVVDDRVLWVIYWPPGGNRHHLGEIATVIPAGSAARKQCCRDFNHKFRRLNGFSKRQRRHH